MRFLLRITFWLGLVLVLLPRDKTPEAEKLPQIGAADAVQAATAAVSDASQFCKRQPAACEVGGQAAAIIGQRAQDGARKLYQIINDKKEQITNDKNDKVGTLDDVIIDRDRNLFAVLQVGGFLGINTHLVAVPYQDLVIDGTGKKIELPGASRDELKKLTEFKYPTS